MSRYYTVSGCILPLQRFLFQIEHTASEMNKPKTKRYLLHSTHIKEDTVPSIAILSSRHLDSSLGPGSPTSIRGPRPPVAYSGPHRCGMGHSLLNDFFCGGLFVVRCGGGGEGTHGYSELCRAAFIHPPLKYDACPGR